MNISDLEKRVAKLEAAVFGANKSSLKIKETRAGIVGGLDALVREGFFVAPKMASEVHAALVGKGIHYGQTQVGTALRRASKPGKPLVSLRGTPIKFAERK